LAHWNLHGFELVQREEAKSPVTDPIHRLEQELAELSDRSRSLAESLYEADLSYLRTLGAAAGQQLILASYRICTHKYPEQFLALPFMERQNLQQALRQLARNLSEQLAQNLALPIPKPERKQRIVKVEAIERPKSSGRRSANGADNEDNEGPSTAEMAAALAAAFNSLVNIESIELEGDDADDTEDSEDSDDETSDRLRNANPSSERDDDDLAADAEEEADSEPESDPEPRPPAIDLDAGMPEVLATLANHPSRVLQWHRSREKLTNKTLRAQSHQANELLRSVGILPRKLPSAMLDIAAKGDFDDFTGNSPNLIELIMQGEGDDDSDNDNDGATRLVAVHLRLSEIHFSNPDLKPQRAAIQQVLEQLDQLRTRYEKVQHRQAIASAESAWRSAWFED
jgi:hypothetical protein